MTHWVYVLKHHTAGILCRRYIYAGLSGLGFFMLLTALVVMPANPGLAANNAVPIKLLDVAPVPGVSQLQFDDPVSVIPAEAIERLIMSGRVMGSRLRLKGGLEIYFPDGFVVLGEWESKNPTEIADLRRRGYEPLFGRQCAEELGARGHWQMFRASDGSFTFVEELGENNQPMAVRITEARDPDFLQESAMAKAMILACLQRAP